MFAQIRLWVVGGFELLLLAAVFWLGWHVRGLSDDAALAALRAGQLSALIAEQKTTIGAQDMALARARDYELAAAALKPQIVRVQADAAPIIAVLDKCPLPADAVQLLDRAAEIAGPAASGKMRDSGAQHPSDGAAAEVAPASAGPGANRWRSLPAHSGFVRLQRAMRPAD